MLVAILKAVFLFFLIFVVILWVYCLVNWDGKCHDDCKDCLYDDGHCKLKEEREHGR